MFQTLRKSRWAIIGEIDKETSAEAWRALSIAGQAKDGAAHLACDCLRRESEFRRAGA